MRRQPVSKDGDENQIIDAEDDLQHDQREETGDDLWIEQEFYQCFFPIGSEADGLLRDEDMVLVRPRMPLDPWAYGRMPGSRIFVYVEIEHVFKGPRPLNDLFLHQKPPSLEQEA